jgi:hypothetical protein
VQSDARSKRFASAPVWASNTTRPRAVQAAGGGVRAGAGGVVSRPGARRRPARRSLASTCEAPTYPDRRADPAPVPSWPGCVATAGLPLSDAERSFSAGLLPSPVVFLSFLLSAVGSQRRRFSGLRGCQFETGCP